MDSMEIEIISFLSPHVFYICTDLDVQRRSTFLDNVSSQIQRAHLGPQIEPFSNDHIIAVFHQCKFARATVVDKILNADNDKNVYFCWLIDYGQLVKAEILYKLPTEIQKITPRCKQASLNNFCYLKEVLELGVTGTIKTEPTLLPSSGVIQICLDLLSNCDKLEFQVIERFHNTVIGELLIHKCGKILNLTEVLCNRGLIEKNEIKFESLKHSTKEYIKTHMNWIHEIGSVASKSPNCSIKSTSSPKEKSLEVAIEEIDINQPPLENGRRRRRLTGESPTSPTPLIQSQSPTSTKTDQSEEKISTPKKDATMSRSEHLLKLIKSKEAEKAQKSSEEEKKETKPTSKPKDVWKKVMEFKRAREAAKASSKDEDTSSTVNSSSLISDSLLKAVNVTSEIESESIEENKEKINITESETTTSPFASITSQRKSKPVGLLFMPAGMERSMVDLAVKKKPPKPKKGKKSVSSRDENVEKPISAEPKHNTSLPSADEDCPTIQIPKDSGNMTDDQISADEVKNSKSEKKEDTSSSDSSKTNIFTKQDFCKLMSGCACLKCRVVMEDDDWDTPIKFEASEPQSKAKSVDTGLVIKPPRLLNSSQDSAEKREILSIDYDGMSSMEKRMSCKVLVHGESIPIPIKQVSQVQIHRDIYNSISRINYKESKRIQHYAFPSITRNQHVFMVNDQKSGKTMAYLPILLSFIMEKEERYGQLLKLGGGPFIVILCSNSRKCEEIADLTKMILGWQNRKCNLVTYPGYGNISNVDILITMPTVLSTLVSSRATNFKRLCHLVLEDADVILKCHHDLIWKYLKYADQVLQHRNCPKSIQLIVCAQHWTNQLEDIVAKLNKVPTVCIGNHLEAALYGKMKFTMKFLDTECKEENLQKLLQNTYKFTRSVVICNADELEDVQTFLTLKGIDFTSFIDISKEEDILYLEAVWNNSLPGRYSVLLCTDDVFNTMNITNAQFLIHFSLPHSWSQFIRRYSCLLENVRTPLDASENKFGIGSFVFIDENCEQRMAKFCNFIKIAGLEKELPEKIKEFFGTITLEEEQTRLSRNIELCQTLKLFGKCSLPHCKQRHLIDQSVDRSNLLPKNGTIRFKILKMTTAGTCSIKLLEHFDLNGKSVRTFDDLTDKITEMIASKTSYHQISKAAVNHLYLHKENDKYYRCKVLELGEFVLIYLIDRGIYNKGDLSKLYKMPEELKKIPPQAFEIHFAHLIPPFEDNRFSRLASRKAQFLIDSNCPDSLMTGDILLQLGNNLWVDDICEQREMHDKSLPSIGFQLTRELVKNGLAVKSTKTLEELYKLCKNSSIELPEYNVNKPTVKKKTVAEVKPSWAFLDVNEIHEVTFTSAANPDEFYIRQNKFTKQLQQLEEDIQKQIRKPFYPLPQKIESGKCYLAKDPVNGTYFRGLILSVEGDAAEVLSVDYGDIIMEDKNNLKHISNDLITKLPFQSIQCSMHGVKSVDGDWSEDATDLLYKKAYEDDAATLRRLFVQIASKQTNLVVPSQNSYKVTLKDGLLSRLLINELLIDCGFALPTGEEIRDFDLPPVDTDEDSIEEICRSDDEDDYDCDNAPYVPDPDVKPLNEEDFDFQIFDLADFMIAQNFPVRKLDSNKAIEDAKPSSSQLPPLKAVPTVDYITPEAYWSDTDTHVKLNIKICDVIQAKIVIRHNRSFQFNTTIDGKKYHLNLLLFGKVESKFQHTILGPQVRVTLTKVKAGKWPRLLHTQDKVRKIYYDVTAIDLEEVDETQRKFLDLGISDSSSDEDDNQRPYFVCSDLDSDYDYDIPNDYDE